jgi:hypothetical protein
VENLASYSWNGSVAELSELLKNPEVPQLVNQPNARGRSIQERGRVEGRRVEEKERKRKGKGKGER